MDAKKVLLPLSLTALLAGGGAIYNLYGGPLASYAQAQTAQNQTAQNQTAQNQATSATIAPLNEKNAFLQDENNTVDVFKTYGPSVVAVNVEVSGQRVDPFAGQNVPPEFQQFFRQFGMPQGQAPQTQRGAGSGFVVDAQGRLMTNYHVVESALQDGTSKLKAGAKLTVSFTGSEKELPVRVVGVNPSYDLALLELVNQNALPKGVEPITIANSDALEVGQKVIAIGNPFGLQSTVTTGIISAVGRDFTSIGQFNFPVIQTDAAINPGNSGGPLLNSKGELIGINTAIISNASSQSEAGSVGIGFAIPSNNVTSNLASLEKGGYADVYTDKPRMGVQVADISAYPANVRRSLGLPTAGEMVMAVEPGSPAAKAGLRGPSFEVTVDGQQLPAGGDVITAIDGQALTDSANLQTVIFAKKPGDVVALTVWRGGKAVQVDVTLAIVPVSQKS